MEVNKMKQYKKIFALVMILLILPLSTFKTATITTSAASSNSSAISKPKNIKASSTGTNSIKVSWKKVKGASGYMIYRSTRQNGSYKRVDTVSSRKSSYTNKNLKANKKYYYKVRAFKDTNTKIYRSKYSSSASAKTNSKITASKAKQIALAKTGGGTVTKCELDYENGVKVYDIEIIDGRIEYDVHVRVSDGKIVKFEKDYD